MWDEDKATACDRMNELSEYFGGARGLGKVDNDEGLKVWFSELGK